MKAELNNTAYQPNTIFLNSTGGKMKISLLTVYMSDFGTVTPVIMCKSNLRFDFSSTNKIINRIETNFKGVQDDIRFDFTRQNDLENGECLEQSFDDFGTFCSQYDVKEVNVPCFQIGGYYDLDGNGTTESRFDYKIINDCPNCIGRAKWLGKSFIFGRDTLKFKLNINSLLKNFNLGNSINNDTLIMNSIRNSISIE